jgi:hypothetical protein
MPDIVDLIAAFAPAAAEVMKKMGKKASVDDKILILLSAIYEEQVTQTKELTKMSEGYSILNNKLDILLGRG